MASSFPTLSTEHYLLRQISLSDLENIFKGLSDPDVIKYYGISYDSLEETRGQLKWYSDLEANETGIWWAICDTQSGEFLGASGFSSINRKFRKAEIGFWLYPKNWRRGIMNEVLPVITEFAFNKLMLHRIEGFVEIDNTASRNLLKKNGFTDEGIMRDAEIQHGRFISLHIISKLSTD